MNKLDEFFKKKVDAAQTEPRAEAWSKVEAHLSKKNKGLIWFRAAAALFMLGLFITSIIWWQQKDVSQPLAKETIKENSPAGRDDLTPEQNASAQARPIEQVKDIKLRKESGTKRQKGIKNEVTESSEPEPQTEIKSEPVLELPAQQTVTTAVAMEKPIVIEYTLESVPLRKKEVAVAAAEKKNSLQKAIEFAREAKNSDSPLGGLRQAKDDLFALNFKKDKQKKQ